MKTQRPYVALILVALLFSFHSCNKAEESSIDEISEDIAFIDIKTLLKQEIVVSAGKQALTLDEILDAMNVSIFQIVDGIETPILFSDYRDLPELIELPGAGEYFLSMYSIGQGPTAFNSRFDNGFYGYQGYFTVTSGNTTTINANLQLLDVAVSIDFTEEVLTNYPGIEADAIIIDNIGDTLSPSLSWLATDDTRTGYFNMTMFTGILDFFLPNSGNLVINIRAQADDGTELLVTKTYENASPNQHYMITVSYATSTAGINVTLGDEVIIEDEIPFPG